MDGHLLVRLVNVGRTSVPRRTEGRARTGGTGDAAAGVVREGNRAIVRELQPGAGAPWAEDARRRRGEKVAEMSRMMGEAGGWGGEALDSTLGRERDRGRSAAISSQLQQHLGRRVRGFARFGEAVLVEHELSNTSQAPLVVAIDAAGDSSELSVIPTVSEWRQLRARCVARGATWGLVPSRDPSGVPDVERVAGVGEPGAPLFVGPGESVIVPFRVQVVRGQLPPPGEPVVLRASFLEPQVSDLPRAH